MLLSSLSSKSPLNPFATEVIYLTKEERVVAMLVDNRVIVWDVEWANKLYRTGFYGKYVGVRKVKDFEVKRPLELSLLEACYLLEKGIIKVVDGMGRELSLEELMNIGRKTYDNFDDAYLVYKDLKKHGYVIKSGLKFGSTFAVYEHGPGIDHAPFLVHILPYKERLDPLEIIRAGRLSHSVRKKFVIATVEPRSKKVKYFMFKWFG